MAQKKQNQSRLRTPSSVTTLFLLTGLWLSLSPYILGFAWYPAAWWNALVIGMALIVISLIRYFAPGRFQGLQWTALMLGAWMIASPFVAEYLHISNAMWNAFFVGALTIVGATVSAAQPAHHPV